MNAQEVVRQLEDLFFDTGEGFNSDGSRQFESDHATGLLPADIENCGGSEDLKSLLREGYMLSRGSMSVILTSQQPDEMRNGTITLELAGQPPYNAPRIGARLDVLYDEPEGHVMNAKVTPSREMLKDRQHPMSTRALFQSFDNQSSEEMANDARALINLSRIAIGQLAR